jgi:hypothetical protein
METPGHYNITVFEGAAIATFVSHEEKIRFIKAMHSIKRRYGVTNIFIPNEDRVFRL